MRIFFIALLLSAQISALYFPTMSVISKKLRSGAGDSSSNYLGTSTVTIDDLNGDGIREVMVGAPGDYKGIVYLHFFDGGSTVTKKIGDGIGGFPNVLPEGAGFGSAIALFSDLDNDGIDEVIVGASNCNSLYILYLSSSGVVTGQKTISSGISGKSVFSGVAFGSSIERISDLDGNGIREVVVGDPEDGDGIIYILYFNSTGDVIWETKIGNMYPFISPVGSLFGSSLAMMNEKTGITKFIVGAPGLSTFYILRINSDGMLLSNVSKTMPTATNFGSAVSVLRDIGSYQDICITSSHDNSLWFMSIGNNDEILDERKYFLGSGGMSTGGNTYSVSGQFGSSVSLFVDDVMEKFLIVGSSRDNQLAVDSGATFILSMDSFPDITEIVTTETVSTEIFTTTVEEETETVTTGIITTETATTEIFTTTVADITVTITTENVIDTITEITTVDKFSNLLETTTSMEGTTNLPLSTTSFISTNIVCEDVCDDITGKCYCTLQELLEYRSGSEQMYLLFIKGDQSYGSDLDISNSLIDLDGSILDISGDFKIIHTGLRIRNSKLVVEGCFSIENGSFISIDVNPEKGKTSKVIIEYEGLCENSGQFTNVSIEAGKFDCSEIVYAEKNISVLFRQCTSNWIIVIIIAITSVVLIVFAVVILCVPSIRGKVFPYGNDGNIGNLDTTHKNNVIIN